jgi:hypothetical protein
VPIDQTLYEYATPRQREFLEAIEQHGSARAANIALGLANDKVSAAMRRLHAFAAKKGYAPGHFESGTAPGFAMGKVTIQRAADGTVERTWERQSPDAERLLEGLRAAVEGMAGEIVPCAPVVAPTASLGDLLAVYTLTDAHIGMLAWHREGGADWDLRIAEDTIVGCFTETIRQMPATGQAILSQLGDLLHYDGLSAVTPTSGHILDADGRFTKMVEVAVRVIRRIVAMLLAKHDRVHLVMAEGNHDMASSVWLRTMFKALYELEPRITVDDSALPYYAFEFGSVMQIFHHSHLKKNDQLPLLVAAQFPEMWGRTKYRYIHTGNLHHHWEKEFSGVTVIQHQTLAARDAYAARGGWIANRAMDAITYHRNFGQVGRVIVNPEMLEAA